VLVHHEMAVIARWSDLTIPASCAMVICSWRALAVTCRTCQCTKHRKVEMDIPQLRVLVL
jgi:hypothetical protein